MEYLSDIPFTQLFLYSLHALCVTFVFCGSFFSYRGYEKPLLIQLCRLLRGFTHPGTYFDSSTEEIALFRYVFCPSLCVRCFCVLLVVSVSVFHVLVCGPNVQMHTWSTNYTKHFAPSQNICHLITFSQSYSYFIFSSVERFAEEMDTLLEITLRSNLVEKLSMALYDCLFGDEEEEEAESKVQIMFLCLNCSYLLQWLHMS